MTVAPYTSLTFICSSTHISTLYNMACTLVWEVPTTVWNIFVVMIPQLILNLVVFSFVVHPHCKQYFPPLFVRKPHLDNLIYGIHIGPCRGYFHLLPLSGETVQRLCPGRVSNQCKAFWQDSFTTWRRSSLVSPQRFFTRQFNDLVQADSCINTKHSVALRLLVVWSHLGLICQKLFDNKLMSLGKFSTH